MKRASRLALLALLVSCTGTVHPPAPPPTVAHTGPKERLPYPASRVLPDVSEADAALLPAPKRLVRREDGTLTDDDRILDRMRVTFEKGGVLRRADDLLPLGAVSAVELPQRLGGGFVFAVINARGTQVFRSDAWLAKLKPVVEVGLVADRDEPVIVGFDRLYLHLASTNELVAFDASTGQPLELGPLPIAPSFGEMVFIDGWRAVVDTELRGVLATFDAGATWRSVPIAEKVKSIRRVADDAVVDVEGGEYRLDDHGRLTFSADDHKILDAITAAVAPSKPAKESPLGKRPLRAALEDGYPDEGRTAIVARGGAIARVRLDDGSIAALHEHAMSETGNCHAIKLGPRFGFVCGEPTGKTLLYEFAPPLGAKLVASFDDPRVVTESGQGLVVIEGSCAAKNADAQPRLPDKSQPSTPRSFCVRGADGVLREIRVRGDVGSERVVALSDGRVIVLVPPREGAMGQLSIIDRGAAKRVTLKIPDEAPVKELESGMWLDGFQESASDRDGKPSEIAGWVEAGGPYVGVRIKLDGTVSVGQLVEEDTGVLLSGPFGLAVGARGRALETVDGGLSWKDIVLPISTLPSATEPLRADQRVRRCGPVGCALPGLLRVGWGEPAVPYDLAEAPDPPPLHVPLAKLAFAPLSIDCREELAVSEAKPVARPNGKPKPTSGSQTPGGWNPFRGIDPPELQPDEDGIDNGTAYDATPVRAYVWGKKDADWSSNGRYLIRFSDAWTRADVTSSGPSQSLWADEAAAGLAFGVGSYGYATTWTAWPEVEGGAAIVSSCRSSRCGLFAVAADRPVLGLRAEHGTGALAPPYAGSVVRVGETWFYLADAEPQRTAIYRADLGTIRKLREVSILRGMHGADAVPTLVRRAHGGVGLAFVARRDTSNKKGERYVMPVDAETGELGDPVDLGPNDLASLAPVACDDARDGWLLDVPASDPDAIVRIYGVTYVAESPRVRLRIDPGFACVEAATAKADRPLPRAPAARDRSTDASFPLVLSQLGGGPRTTLACTAPAR